MEDSLPSNEFNFIKLSLNQSIWAGNRNQLYHYEGSQFSRVPLNISNQEAIAEITTDLQSRCIVALTNGRILITDKGGVIYESKGPENAEIHSILLNPDNVLYAATSKGIFHIHLNSILNGNPTQPDWLLLSPLQANHLTYSHEIELWASSPIGVIRFDIEAEKIIQKNAGLEDAYIDAVIESKDQQGVFIQTVHRVYKLIGNQLQHIQLPTRFDFNKIKCIEARSKDELWIGTEKDGLWKMSIDKWTQYSMTDGLPSNNISSLRLDSFGNLWVGTSNGLSRLDDQHWITIGPQMGMPQTQVYSLSYNLKTKSLFAGTEWGGTMQLDASNIRNHERPEFARNQLFQEGKPLIILGNHLAVEHPPTAGFNEILHNLPYSSWLLTGDFDPSGNLWLGRQWSGGGLIKMNWPSPEALEPEFEEMWTKKDGLRNANIWSIWAESQHRVWLGTEEGIFIKTQNDWIPIPHQSPDQIYQAMYILPTTQGEVWVGTDKGIGKIKQGKYFPITTGTLLDETMVWTMHQDSEGSIRVGTNSYGMYIINDGIINHLTIQSGLSGNSIYDILEQPKGVFWFANEYGIDRHIAHKSPLKAYFQSIRGNQTYNPKSKLPDFNIQSRLVLDVRTSNITSTEQKSNYRVKIKRSSGQEMETQTIKFGEDRLEWVPTKSGDYTFELVAFDQNLFQSEPAILKLKVIPPWYRNRTTMVPLSLGTCVVFLWMVALAFKGIKHRKETRFLKEELLNQETKTRQNLEIINENLRDAKQQAIDAKKEAEKASDAKSLFLAKMSHEIRTPLNAVLGYSQMLKGNSLLDEPTLTGLSAIENSGQHLLEIINDILTLSKIESSHVKLQPHDFALTELLDSISEMVSLNCKKKGLQWRIQCTEWWFDNTSAKYEMKSLAIKPPWPRLAFHSDIAKIRQILLNLLTNAIKFTHEGSITLEIRIQHPNTATHTKKEISPPLEIYFTVTDTGSGMEQDDIQRVFHAFEQGTNKGSGEQQGIGLGLSIGRRLVEVLGGKLNCQSRPNKGSRFYFTLPIAQAKYRTLLNSVSKMKPNWKDTPPLALIVDDLEQNSTVLLRLLNLLDIRSESVGSGQEAIQFLKNKTPDIIFMDIMMPKMTGIEAFEKIKSLLGANAPKCVAYSAHVLEHEKELYDRALFDGLLAKPIELDELIQIIFELFPDRINSDEKEDKNKCAHKEIQQLGIESKNQLINAAERYAVTELMRKFDRLQSSETLSSDTCLLLRSLTRSGDVKKLLKVLR
jgi:signal transduction histidine kinase/ligand-binding sensor domain-containing protein/CheY-like chemotaxis protein